MCPVPKNSNLELIEIGNMDGLNPRRRGIQISLREWWNTWEDFTGDGMIVLNKIIIIIINTIG